MQKTFSFIQVQEYTLVITVNQRDGFWIIFDIIQKLCI